MVWIKGRSGNPNGRPVSTDVAKARQTILAKTGKLIGVIEKAAADGDWKAADCLLRYVVAPPQPTYQFDLPNGASGLSDKITAILAAVAAGKLPPEPGARLLDSLARIAQLDAIRSIEQQIEKLANESEHGQAIPGASAALSALESIVKGGNGQ